MGQPATGYQWSPAVTPFQGLVTYNSGWNQATGSNDGRTGFAAYRTMMSHNGQGDLGNFYTYCQLNSQRVGATHWLASPNCFIGAADISALVAGGSLYGFGDINISDNGHDSTGIGTVFNMTRNNNTGALGTVWMGHYVSSAGSKAIDAGYVLRGPALIGLDTTQATSVSAAVNIATGQKIRLNSTATAIGGINWFGNNYGGSWIQDDSGTSEIQFGYNDSVGAAVTAQSSSTDHFLLGATASGGAALSVEGSNTNAGAVFATKGTGVFFFKTGGLSGRIGFEIDDVPSSVNWLKSIPSTTANPAILAAGGSDTNIGISLIPKGSGAVTLGGTTAPTVSAFSTAGVVTTNAAGLLASSTTLPSGLTIPSPVLTGTVTGAAVDTANTASTLVKRDSSGNFSAGTITASLTGHASLDCAITGCTFTGSIGSTSASSFAPQNFVENTANDANASYLQFRKQRSGAVVQVGDTIGTFLFQAYNSGLTYSNAAYFASVVQTAGASPTADLEFYTGGSQSLQLVGANANFGGYIKQTDATALVRTAVALNNGAAAATGTLTNAPAAGNPTKWIPINDNGTTRYIPAW